MEKGKRFLRHLTPIKRYSSMPCYLGLGEASGLQLILSNRYHVESRI